MVKKLRCFFCRKRITEINSFKCVCGNRFCLPHRYHYIHKCEAENELKETWKEKIKIENPVIKKDPWNLKDL